MPLIPIPAAPDVAGKTLLNSEGKQVLQNPTTAEDIIISNDGALRLESYWEGKCNCCTCCLHKRTATITFTGIVFPAGCNGYAIPGDYISYNELISGDPNGTYELDAPNGVHCEQSKTFTAALSVKRNDVPEESEDRCDAVSAAPLDIHLHIWQDSAGRVMLAAFDNAWEPASCLFYGRVVFDDECDGTALDTGELGVVDEGSPPGMSLTFLKIASGGTATITLAAP
jgi:hypothetical protein